METMSFIEVKTRGDYPLENFKKKRFLNWWTQSFLVGIPKIYCGVRTRDEHVNKIEEWSVEGLPSICQDYWSPARVLNSGAEFLTRVNDVMAEVDCPYTVYQFSCDNYKYEIFRGKNQLSFLPDNFIDFVNTF